MLIMIRSHWWDDWMSSLLVRIHNTFRSQSKWGFFGLSWKFLEYDAQHVGQCGRPYFALWLNFTHLTMYANICHTRTYTSIHHVVNLVRQTNLPIWEPHMLACNGVKQQKPG